MREHLKKNPQLRRIYSREKTRGVPFDYGQNYDELKGILTKDNIKINDISHHLKLRAVEREISSRDIEDALRNSLGIGKIKYDDKGRPSKEYIGENARVQINPDTGKIVAVWRTSSKLRKKIYW